MAESWDKQAQQFLKSYWHSWQEQISFPRSIDWREKVNGLRNAYVHLTQSVEPNLPSMRDIVDFELDGSGVPISARRYVPHGASTELSPCLVYYHGGGFVLGDLDSFDSICRRLADVSDCQVVSVDYRLAPEHKYPVPIEDGISAYKWVVEHAEEMGIDREKLAVGGDSAGGNIAINVTREALKGECVMPVFQLLIYPLTQFANIRSKGVKLHEGTVFSAEVYDLFQKAYLPEGQDPMDERVSPLFASEWDGLPPAHFVVAGLDPLKDEGEAYMKKLQAVGITCGSKEYKLEPHGFLNLTAFSAAAREAIHDAAEVLRHKLVD